MHIYILNFRYILVLLLNYMYNFNIFFKLYLAMMEVSFQLGWVLWRRWAIDSAWAESCLFLTKKILLIRLLGVHYMEANMSRNKVVSIVSFCF